MGGYLRMLGGIELEHDGRRQSLPPGKTTAMLCYLAYRGNWVGRDEIAALLWPNSAEGAAKKNLRQLLSTASRLPHVHGLEIEEGRLRWRVATDVAQFRHAAAEGRAGTAAQLYRGELLAGLPVLDAPEYGEWLDVARRELQDQFARSREALAKEYGAEPEDDLVALAEGIRRDRVGDATTAPVREAGEQAESVPAKPVLPVPLTPFVGRQGDRVWLSSLLGEGGTRLVTLTGPGGIGKTRLAIEVARNVADAFEHGVRFVNLAPVASADLVVTAIADAVGFVSYGAADPVDQLTDYLRERQMLLVLDNFEQVIDAGPLVADLLASAPKLRVLVTSRAALRVYGEQEYVVPPLSLPDRGEALSLEALRKYEAVQLFVQRALAVKPDFAVTNDTAPAVTEICRRLDGLALAIELAAARIRLFPPEALLARLSRRLDTLTGGARNLPSRQQTLRGAIDWSYSLLTLDEQRLLARLSVFVGGCGIEAVEAVCDADGSLGMDALEGIDSLVTKSLLRPSDGRGAPRFLMLETIHEYATEKLVGFGEADALARAHAEYFLALATEAAQHLTGPDQATWFARLELEHDDLRAALDSSLRRGDEEVALRLAGALWRFWMVRGHLAEGRAWLDRALAGSAGAGTLMRAKALNGAGALAWAQDDLDRAQATFSASLRLCRELQEQEWIGGTLNNLGLVALKRGEDADARAFFEECLAIVRQRGDKRAIAGALNNLGLVAHRQGDFASERTLAEESLGIRRELGDHEGIATSLGNLGLLAESVGDREAACDMFEESLRVAREIGSQELVASALGNLAGMAERRGDVAVARRRHLESLEIQHELGQPSRIVERLEGLARLANPGDLHRAVRLMAAAQHLRTVSGVPLVPEFQAAFQAQVEVARARMGAGAFDRAWAEGSTMTLAEAVDYAVHGAGTDGSGERSRLQIEFDEQRMKSELTEITETEYFQRISSLAKDLRPRKGGPD